jgi:hypothetical protein
MDHATHLGLDVHKDTIAVAILRPDQNAPEERSSRTPPRRYASWLPADGAASSPATRPVPRATRRTAS